VKLASLGEAKERKTWPVSFAAPRLAICQRFWSLGFEISLVLGSWTLGASRSALAFFSFFLKIIFRF
jgi:hypothetical protein